MKEKKRRTIVFDLDGSLETPYLSKKDVPSVKERLDREYGPGLFDRMYAEVLDGMPHFFLNGALELLQWVSAKGFDIVFFSNAVRARNEELCPILMKRAFAGRRPPKFRIYSRADCIDTSYMHDEGERSRYNGLWHGNYKKRLAGVIVPPEELADTLMIEDDNSYACRGEEANFVYGVYGGSSDKFLTYPREWSMGSGDDFHLPFYFCGMLASILDYAQEHDCPLVDAAVYVQYTSRGLDFPRDGNRKKDKKGGYINVPYPPKEDMSIYRRGLKELRTINPELDFWKRPKKSDLKNDK